MGNTNNIPYKQSVQFIKQEGGLVISAMFVSDTGEEADEELITTREAIEPESSQE